VQPNKNLCVEKLLFLHLLDDFEYLSRADKEQQMNFD